MYKCISDIKKANKKRGHYFFSPSTMKFFDSRISPTVYHGRYFITSEAPHAGAPRRYTIRRAEDDGVITTVGDFHFFASLEEAKKEVKKLKN